MDESEHVVSYCKSLSPMQPEGNKYLCEKWAGHEGNHQRTFSYPIVGTSKMLAWGPSAPSCTGISPPQPEHPAGVQCGQADGHAGPHTQIVKTLQGLASLTWGAFARPETCDKPDTAHGVKCDRPKGHEGAHQWEGQISTAWEDAENTALADAEAAWQAYKAQYVKDHPEPNWQRADPKRVGRRLRRREFISGYLAALPEWNG